MANISLLAGRNWQDGIVHKSKKSLVLLSSRLLASFSLSTVHTAFPRTDNVANLLILSVWFN